jgi:hypothetical protein
MLEYGLVPLSNGLLSGKYKPGIDDQMLKEDSNTLPIMAARWNKDNERSFWNIVKTHEVSEEIVDQPVTFLLTGPQTKLVFFRSCRHY